MSTSIITALNIYPIKSTAGISLSNIWLDDYGLSFDRRFILMQPDGEMITARTEPKLCLIQANLTTNGLTITAPNMPILIVNISDFSDKYSTVTVWEDRINSQHGQVKYDQWFSHYLGKPCQLMYFSEQSSRFVKQGLSLASTSIAPKHTVQPEHKKVAFADGYPILLISQASLDDLNSRLEQPVSMAQFRPNIVVNNCLAFAEDTWQRIRIGEVEFELPKPCSRCIFTTINPKTAEKNNQLQPLKTLADYRQVENGDVMFGQNLIALNQGALKLGDEVSVITQQKSPIFIINNNAKSQNTPMQKNKIPQTHKQSTATQLNLVCKKIIQETDDVKTFVFTNSIDEKIHYIAGQHLPITVEIDGKKIHRCYTLSSSPSRKNSLAITVKRVCDNDIKGIVSTFFHDEFNVGDTLISKQPAGDFHLECADSSKILLLSAGSGITPMLSMLREMTDQIMDNDVMFFHSAKNSSDLIAKDEIEALAHQHGNCAIDYTLTRSAPPSWQDYQGHLNESMLDGIPDLLTREVFVCGPKAFRESAQKILSNLGLPTEQFHYESFGNREYPDVSIEKKVKPRKKNAKITFDGWGKEIKGNTSEPLLDQAEDAGLIIPYSCRAGMCGCCMVKLESGEVKILSDDGLTEFDREQGYILTCCSIPLTDVVISKLPR